MITHNDLPKAIAELQRGQSEILDLLLNKAETPQQDIPKNIKDVSVVTGLSVPTLYLKVQRNEIPYHKKGNRLYFFNSEIIDWIKTGKQKTISELEAENDEFLSNKNKALK